MHAVYPIHQRLRVHLIEMGEAAKAEGGGERKERVSGFSGTPASSRSGCFERSHGILSAVLSEAHGE